MRFALQLVVIAWLSFIAGAIAGAQFHPDAGGSTRAKPNHAPFRDGTPAAAPGRGEQARERLDRALGRLSSQVERVRAL